MNATQSSNSFNPSLPRASIPDRSSSQFKAKSVKKSKKLVCMEYVNQFLVTPKKPDIQKRYIIDSPNKLSNSRVFASVEEHKRSISMQFPDRRGACSSYDFYAVPGRPSVSKNPLKNVMLESLNQRLLSQKNISQEFSVKNYKLCNLQTPSNM